MSGRKDSLIRTVPWDDVNYRGPLSEAAVKFEPPDFAIHYARGRRVIESSGKLCVKLPIFKLFISPWLYFLRRHLPLIGCKPNGDVNSSFLCIKPSVKCNVSEVLLLVAWFL